MNDEWKLVTQDSMALRDYACGVSAGDILALRDDLHYEDHQGRPTGAVRRAGEQAMVLSGNPSEPDVVWIRWRDGERQTWDDSILESFSRIKKHA